MGGGTWKKLFAEVKNAPTVKLDQILVFYT